MPRQTVALVSSLIVLSLVSLCRGQANPPMSVITGTVAYRLRTALPPEATVNVRLEDVSLADAPARIVAQTNFATEGKQVPLPFALKYDPSQLLASHQYSLRVTISANGQTLFATTSSNPINAQTRTTHVDLILAQVTPPVATATPPKNAELEGTYWKLTGLWGKAALKGVAGTEAHLILHASDNRIAGSTGCNSVVGSYKLNRESLHFTPATMTMMACTPALMKQEQDFTDALKTTTSYRIDGQQLELLNGDLVAARFQAKYLK